MKQRSIDQLEYINPDEEINKVEEEIESHIKAKEAEELTHPKEEPPEVKEGKTANEGE